MPNYFRLTAKFICNYYSQVGFIYGFNVCASTCNNLCLSCTALITIFLVPYLFLLQYNKSICSTFTCRYIHIKNMKKYEHDTWFKKITPLMKLIKQNDVFLFNLSRHAGGKMLCILNKCGKNVHSLVAFKLIN